VHPSRHERTSSIVRSLNVSIFECIDFSIATTGAGRADLAHGRAVVRRAEPGDRESGADRRDAARRRLHHRYDRAAASRRSTLSHDIPANIVLYMDRRSALFYSSLP
jgi:hypothetical protein